MCADAMKLVKAAIKSAGAHKQRITLNISIDGIKIRDEKTSILIHNFPVSKISFIARDTTDARAFGFVYGTHDNKYKFYGIKTAQTADHAVLAIRDMFQVVFEMKKKQIEEVKQKKEELENDENVKKESGNSSGSAESGLKMENLIDLESELEHIALGFNTMPVFPPPVFPPTSATPTNNSSTNPFGDPSSYGIHSVQQPVINDSWISNNSTFNSHDEFQVKYQLPPQPPIEKRELSLNNGSNNGFADFSSAFSAP